MKRTAFLLGILFLAFASCKKDKKDNDCTLSVVNLAGSYKVTALKYKAPSTPEADVFDTFVEDCNRDDITTFNTDNTINYADAGVSCTPNENRNGTFSLSGNAITIEGNTGTVEGFTCNSFSVFESDVFTSGDKFTLTYTRQ